MLEVMSLRALREPRVHSTEMRFSASSFRFALVACLSLSTAVVASETVFNAKIVGVIDGDTVSVMHKGRPITIRVYGIDCPEDGQDFSNRAKQFTSARAFGKTVTIEPRDTDRYGRTVARVLVDEEDLGLALVRAGLAWRYKETRDSALARAETTARESRVGLWSHAKPIPPWAYRRPIPLADAVGPFHGNARSFVFHRFGCPNYECQSCTRVFKTRADAVAAGYRAAGDCLK